MEAGALIAYVARSIVFKRGKVSMLGLKMVFNPTGLFLRLMLDQLIPNVMYV